MNFFQSVFLQNLLDLYVFLALRVYFNDLLLKRQLMARKGCDRHLAVLEQVSHFEFEVIVASHQSVNLCQGKNVVDLLLLHEEAWSLIKGHQTPPASNFSLSKN